MKKVFNDFLRKTKFWRNGHRGYINEFDQLIKIRNALRLNRIEQYKSEFLLNFLFFTCFAFILIIRVLLFFDVNINHIDSDQPLMWLGARDYSKGLFYEPRFYGQNYNTFMEALLAVPLLWSTVPVYYAVPLITHILFLFPFFFSAFYLFINKRKEQGALVLIILLCMPTGYDMMNSLPRGFVTGLFFTSFFVISFLNPKNLRWILINSIFAIVGFFVNPNSTIVSLPFAVFVFLNNYKQISYYYAMSLCIVTLVALHFFFNQFYRNHPDYIIHPLKLDVSLIFFMDNISQMDNIFGKIGFFIEDNCLLLLGVFILLFFLLKNGDKIVFYAFLSFIVLIFISFFTSKVNDGTPWVYFSYSRMFLGIPLAIYLFISKMEIKRNFVFFLGALALGFSSYKLANQSKQISEHTESKRWVLLRLMSLQEALHLMNHYKTKCKEQNANTLLVANNFWLSNFLVYGGPACFADFPQTMETKSDRRYWVREKFENKTLSNFVYLSTVSDLDKRLINKTEATIRDLDNYGLFNVRDNKLPTYLFAKMVIEEERN